MPNYNRNPQVSLFMARIGWILVSLFGVALAWTFLQEWPPLDGAGKIAVSIMLAVSSTGFLCLAMDGADRDGTMDAFWRMRVNCRENIPLPPEGSYLWSVYKYAAARLMIRVCCEHAYAMGCLKILPWGAAILAMHAVFRFGFSAMRDMKPEMFDGSDPDMAVAVALTEPSIDATLAAFLLLCAWMR